MIFNYDASANIWIKYLEDNNTKLDASRCHHNKCLIYLNELNIYKQNLIDVDFSINKLVKLDFLRLFSIVKTLKLNANLISNIEPLSQLISLERLDLSSNLIINLNPIKNLVNLIKLNLNDNQVKSIDVVLNNLCHLMIFDASNNQIKSIRIVHNYSSNLAELELTNNLIETIDESFVYLTKLKRLYLGKNKLRFINKEIIQKLINLEYFNMEFNSVQKIDDINDNDNIYYLHFGNNLIRNVDFICQD